jgi:Na+-translocating ferredoxin:NAD+ oxidoreductase RnfC subunit
MKKPFFGLTKPKLTYSGIDDIGQDIREIPPPEKICLLREIQKRNPRDLTISKGHEVRTGQRLRPFADMDVYLTATATGVITDVSLKTEFSDRTLISVSIESGQKDLWDPEFEKAGISAEAEDALHFFSTLRGSLT